MKANWKNRTLFHGDNLVFLRALNTDSVDLIATDPPFNKGKDFHATPDSLAAGASFQDRWTWEKQHEDWLSEIADESEKLKEAIDSAYHCHSEAMGAFVCFLAVRLMEMHRILKPTGSIFLHCDQTASHYIKAIMDSIFGVRNFRADITWKRAHAKGNATSNFACNTDTIFYYAKDARKAAFNAPRLPVQEEPTHHFCHIEEETGRRYARGNLRSPQQDPKSPRHYEFLGVTATWRWDYERMEQAHKDGKVELGNDGTKLYQKEYWDERKGALIDNLWTDIQVLNAKSTERLGYPTQKPIELYSRMIEAASNKGDVVLDPFCGCATTCVAAEHLERQWLGADLWEKAGDIVASQLQKHCDRYRLLAADGKAEITYLSTPPARTDEGEPAAPELKPRFKVQADIGPKQSRAEMMVHLTRNGCKCHGCMREFEDAEYLELDHDKPRSEGGRNSIDNRLPLCAPCNKLKSNERTLTGLQKEIRRAASDSNHPRHSWAKNSPLLHIKA